MLSKLSLFVAFGTVLSLLFFSSCDKNHDPVKVVTDTVRVTHTDTIRVPSPADTIRIQPPADSVAAILRGLIGHYTFTGNAADSSGHHNNGTVMGASPTNDKKGKANAAYSFNGTTYISLPVKSLLNHTYAYSIWLRVDVLPGDQQVAVPFSIGQKDDSDPSGHPHQAISLANDYGSAKAYGFNAGGFDIGIPSSVSYQTGALPNVGTWYHLVAVRSSTEILLYMNGVVVGGSLTNITLPDYGTSSAANIGIRANLTGGFVGVIDDVRIYDRALTDNEVATIYWTEKLK